MERRIAQWRILGELATRAGVAGRAMPWLRVLAIRLSRASGSDLAPIPRTMLTARGLVRQLLTAALLEDATYNALAAQLLELRCEKPFPQEPPLRVLAAFGSAPAVRALPFLSGRVRERNETWLARQRQLAELSSHGTLIELADSAHYVPFDRPDAVAEAVREVVAELV